MDQNLSFPSPNPLDHIAYSCCEQAHMICSAEVLQLPNNVHDKEYCLNAAYAIFDQKKKL